MEIWKDIVDYEDYYEISNYGNVRGKNKYKKSSTGNGIVFIPSKPVRTRINKNNGYYLTNLSKEGIIKTVTIHRLVAKAFIPNPENKPQVNHIDGNKLNNNVDNLEWVTKSENGKHAIKMGLTHLPKEIYHRDTHPQSKIMTSDIDLIFNLRKKGVRFKKIANIYSVSVGCIEKIIYKKITNESKKEQRA